MFILLFIKNIGLSLASCYLMCRNMEYLNPAVIGTWIYIAVIGFAMFFLFSVIDILLIAVYAWVCDNRRSGNTAQARRELRAQRRAKLKAYSFNREMCREVYSTLNDPELINFFEKQHENELFADDFAGIAGSKEHMQAQAAAGTGNN